MHAEEDPGRKCISDHPVLGSFFLLNLHWQLSKSLTDMQRHCIESMTMHDFLPVPIDTINAISLKIGFVNLEILGLVFSC